MSSQPVAKVGDRTIGTCYHPSHLAPITVGGTIITGCQNIVTNNELTARIGDLVLTDCGHLGEIVTGSEKVIQCSDKKPVARLGDKVDNRAPYKAEIITASSNVYAEPLGGN
jgi:uncharacterized Zn-binding protein involved in type VI secretion